MTSWNPQGWVIMLAGQDWAAGQGFASPVQSGLDFHLDVQARELRPTYQHFLRGSWVARARNETLVDRGWDCNWGGKGHCNGYGVGGLWNALMLYQKKAIVAAAVGPNGTSTIPTRPIGPSTIPTQVNALIAKWSASSPPPQVTTDAEGTITIPAAAFSNDTGLTTANVAIMKSFDVDGGTQVVRLVSRVLLAFFPSVARLHHTLTRLIAHVSLLFSHVSLSLSLPPFLTLPILVCLRCTTEGTSTSQPLRLLSITSTPPRRARSTSP